MAALAEIAGCFALWAYFRLGQPAWWFIPGLASLAAFAWILTLVETSAAGRAYAAYGGVYIAASLTRLWAVEGRQPDRCDLLDAGVFLAGAGLIQLGPTKHRSIACSAGSPALRTWARVGKGRERPLPSLPHP